MSVSNILTTSQLERFESLDLEDGRGETILHGICQVNMPMPEALKLLNEDTRVLLKHDYQYLRQNPYIKIFVNHSDKKGNTALVYAMKTKQYPLVEALISEGADLTFTRNPQKLEIKDRMEFRTSMKIFKLIENNLIRDKHSETLHIPLMKKFVTLYKREKEQELKLQKMSLKGSKK